MDATLNIISKLIAFTDGSFSSNPRLRAFDWYRDASGISVSDPKSEAHAIPVGTSKLIFNGTRSTTIDGTSGFSIGVSPADPSIYRITHTSGTAPGFRTSRSLNLAGVAVTFAVNSNNTVTISVPVGPDFTGVQVNDTVFVPNSETGDLPNVLAHLNSGFWKVLAVTDSRHIIVSRPIGTDFEGTSETQTLAGSSQLQAYGSTGVQEGDRLEITGGFAQITRQAFVVKTVTSNFVEFVSTAPLPAESVISPTATGMNFYTESKRLIYVECDQDCIVQLNGDTSEFQKVTPIEVGNPDLPGMFLKWGPAWSLTIVNKSTSTLNVLVIHAE